MKKYIEKYLSSLLDEYSEVWSLQSLYPRNTFMYAALDLKLAWLDVKIALVVDLLGG